MIYRRKYRNINNYNQIKINGIAFYRLNKLKQIHRFCLHPKGNNQLYYRFASEMQRFTFEL